MLFVQISEKFWTYLSVYTCGCQIMTTKELNSLRVF